MCRFLPPPGRQQNRSAILRYLVFFDIRKNIEKMRKIKMLKSYRMCRFLPPPGRQQFGSGNLGYLVFFEIRNIFEKDGRNRNVKILIDVSMFAASETATIWVSKSPSLCVFLIFAKILKKMKHLSLKVVAVAGILPPPFRRGLAISWHHFTWPPPQHPATQNPQASLFL